MSQSFERCPAMNLPVAVFFTTLIALAATQNGGYYGKYLGPLSQYHHGVSGEVYVVDARTLHIRDFTYDGEGPAAYFYVGNTKAPGPGGLRIRDETGSSGVLKKYNKKHLTLTLPEGKTLSQMKWFSVWCDEFSVNFGHINIPRGLEYPKPQKIGALNGVHSVTSDSIVVVDAQTLLIPSFSYDGEAPDAKFWVGRGNKPTPQGIRVPDENGKVTPLRKYERKTIVLTLPGDLTIYDIDYFGIWCEAFTVDFGHVKIPQGLLVPPSLRMLGVSPQSKLNCEVLSEDLAFEVRWAVAGDSVVIQLVAKLEDGEYMSFGLSGATDGSIMIGGDVVVAWVDQKTMNGYAIDYFLDGKSQCSGNRGSCPDYRIQPNTESVRLLNAALVNGYSIVTYQRPLTAHDVLDNPIYTNNSQPVIWAVGPLNSKNEVSYHSLTSKGNLFMDFGRSPKWNCPIPDMDTTVSATSEDADRRRPAPVPNNHQHHNHKQHHQQQPATTVKPRQEYKTPPPPPKVAPLAEGAWEIPPIQCNEPEDGVFYAQMGPAGGKRGYPAITGHVGWGIAYYINGLLIPEINVVRGKTYTFVTEGGNNPDIPAKYHPFYITNDPVGGYQYKTPEERRNVEVYAGVEFNGKGEAVPTGEGRLCNWTPDPEEPSADEFASFGAYQRTLSLVCDHGTPGIVQWTPDHNTPDTVYYQCYLHRYLGWKINVLDSCDLPSASGSEPVLTKVKPGPEEPYSRPSIQYATRIKPDQQTLNNLVNNKIPNKGPVPFGGEKPLDESLANVTDKIIPVKEDVEEDSTMVTEQKVTEAYSNVSLSEEVIGKTPIGPPPGPIRVSYPRPPPVTRPNLMVMRRPPHQVMKIPHMGVRPPPPGMNMGPVNMPPPRPHGMKKPPFRLPPPRPMLYMHVPPRPQMPQQPVMPQRLPPKQPVYQQKPKKPEIPMEKPKLVKPPQVHLPVPPPQPQSQQIAQSSEDRTTRLPIAVNTGFNPGSLVIEGGFKPIIPSNVNQHAQERISYDEFVEEGDDDIGVVRLESEDDHEQTSQTQMFEPMFIPSPLDSSGKNKKTTTIPGKKYRKPMRPQYREVPDEKTDERFYVPPNSQYSTRNTNPLIDYRPRVPDIVVGVPQGNVKTPLALALQDENQPTEVEKQEEQNEETETETRKKRSAHHEIGHEGHENHNHENHEHHDHSEHEQHQTHSTDKSGSVRSIPHMFLILLSIYLLH